MSMYISFSVNCDHRDHPSFPTRRSSDPNQGQVCLCGSRVFVERPAYKDFVDRFIDTASQLEMGDPLDEKTEQGRSEEHTSELQSQSNLVSGLLLEKKQPRLHRSIITHHT